MKAENLAGTDDLSDYTTLHRENYLLESAHLVETLPQGASVLQVGSMDGARAIGLLKVRPDLLFTGLDIEPALTDVALTSAKAAKVEATFVTGDILSPPPLASFDVGLCLNNTLSYVAQPTEAISNMRAMAKQVIISVFTEMYDLEEAQAYYDTLGMSLLRAEENAFVMSDGWCIHRFSSSEVVAWGGTQRRTPLGLVVRLPE